MTHRWIALLGATAAVTLAVYIAPGQESSQQADAPAVPELVHVLPKAAPSPVVEKLKLQMQQMIAVRDPETGEFRAPTAAEHQALTASPAAKGSRMASRAAVGDATVYLKNGAVALPADLSQLEFLTVERRRDGSLVQTCGNPLHAHDAHPSAVNGGNANER